MSSLLSSTRTSNSLVETGKFRRSYKVILVGDPRVGKTALFNRILFDKFVDPSVTNYLTSSSTGSFYRPDCFEKTENVFGEDITVSKSHNEFNCIYNQLFLNIVFSP